MIETLILKNFKAFEEQTINFRPLTILSGLNSTGKSSPLQGLLLLRQSYQKGFLPEKGLVLNGDLVNIGTGKDALFEYGSEDSISFELVWKDGCKSKWCFDYNSESDVLNLHSQSGDLKIYDSSLFNDGFRYLQTERIGPRESYPMSDFQVVKHGQLGTKGEFTAHFLSHFGDKDILMSKLAHPKARSPSQSLKKQVDAWMGFVSPGITSHLTQNLETRTVRLRYSFGLSKEYSATNVGFGVSYTLPILVAILASSPGTLILLENPEAYVHPQGQAKIGELLALAASCGIQIVVETHSDHLLNGIRLAVHGGKIDPQDVQLHYFNRFQKEEVVMTEVISPKLDRNGRIDQWPDGFFDEWRKSLAALI